MKEVNNNNKLMDLKEIKEKRFRGKSEKDNSKENLLKYGDVADSSDDDSDENE